MQGQVTRPGQVTQLQNNFPIAPRLHCFRERYETFGIWCHQCLQNVYLRFLISVTSGQVIFATSPLYVNGQKINSVIFTLAQPYLSEIISYRTFVDNSCKNLHCLRLERTFEVTRGHQPSFANNFWSKGDRDVWDWCQYVRLGQANLLICNMTHFGHHVTLAWLDMRSNLDLDLLRSFYIYGSTRLTETNTMVLKSLLYL